MDKRKLNSFYYSQNSINTFKSCPLKFKYKYIENINWKSDDIENRDYYESLEMGTEFHLVCERYFDNIPTGLSNETKYEKFTKWLDKIKELIPIDDNNKYIPEYEIRYKKDDIKLQAKYDLVVIKENKVEIWDWKTENRKLTYKNAESRIQTIVYLYVLGESLKSLFNKNIPYENITMNYYQPDYMDEPISIKYSLQKRKSYEEKLKFHINTITYSDFYIKDNELQNNKHCSFCEFNKLCNNKDISYNYNEDVIE
jgi:hypothetical protein